MILGFGQNVFDDALGEFAGSLVVFQNDADELTRFDVSSFCAAHL